MSWITNPDVWQLGAVIALGVLIAWLVVPRNNDDNDTPDHFSPA